MDQALLAQRPGQHRPGGGDKARRAVGDDQQRRPEGQAAELVQETAPRVSALAAAPASAASDGLLSVMPRVGELVSHPEVAAGAAGDTRASGDHRADRSVVEIDVEDLGDLRDAEFAGPP